MQQVKAQDNFKLENISVRFGYGISIAEVPQWQQSFQFDNFNLGFTLKSYKGIDLSLLAISSGYAHYGNDFIYGLNNYILNLQYRPIRKYNLQPFVGAGISINNYREEQVVFGTWYLNNSSAPTGEYFVTKGPFANIEIGLLYKISKRFTLNVEALKVFGKNNDIVAVPVASEIYYMLSLAYVFKIFSSN